jgi:CubicO group peptidase (beta-lactamase class C family)
MNRTLIALALTVAVGCPLAAQSSTDFDEVRRILREGMAREGAPAAAFAVVRDGKIIWEEAIGWADSVNSRRATPDSPFLLASLNKTFETTLAAVLQSQHQLDIDRPANEYLRSTAMSSPVWDVSHVTVRQLYQHTAGSLDLQHLLRRGPTTRPVPYAGRRRHDQGLRHCRRQARRAL